MNDQTNSRRSFIKTALAAGAVGALPSSFSGIASAQSRPIRVGMTSIFSGRVAQLGISSKNALLLQFDAFNAAGGLAGRKIELIDRDSTGKPEQVAHNTRELIESEGCEIIICGEAASFVTHEIGRKSKALMLHMVTETTQISADPKLRSANIFRTSRQALHDSIAGGRFVAKVAKQKGFTRWATVSPDSQTGREITPEFMGYVAAGGVKVDLVGEAWPKLFQPDYTEIITKILQAKPEAVFCTLWGGDLVSFVDQGNLFGLFDKVSFFAIYLADYTTLTGIKKLPSGAVYSSNRYLSAFPATPNNAAWSGAYLKRFNVHPTNWSWEGDTAARFLLGAMRKTGSADPEKLAAALRGMEIESPVGMKGGKIVMRAEDHTVINYALGWGRIVPQSPYIADLEPANWTDVLAEEATWKKKKGYA